jgi:carbon-monoxide dehydrogenase large subunit
MKGTGGSPTENVELRFEPDGTVALVTGTQHIGQGHETTFPQIVADRLGIPDALVTLRQGDTDLIPTGGGHGSSRATYMAGTAIHRAAEAAVAKGRAVAARALGVAEDAVRYADGAFTAPGSNRSLSLLDAAALARAEGGTLDSYVIWTREHLTFPNGTHVVEVEIDRDTGETALVRHTACDDYGVLVNPMVARGQAHGALAQGAGAALMEQAVFEPGSGQVLTASFLDYPLPRAADLPDWALAFHGTPCTTNPLGVKGAGEAAVGGIFPAIGNAVVDALAPLGVVAFSGPATPERVWQAMRMAR